MIVHETQTWKVTMDRAHTLVVGRGEGLYLDLVTVDADGRRLFTAPLGGMAGESGSHEVVLDGHPLDLRWSRDLTNGMAIGLYAGARLVEGWGSRTALARLRGARTQTLSVLVPLSIALLVAMVVVALGVLGAI